MLFSTTAIRRYTPPTCTLKIIGKTSPLSRWSSQPLFEGVRFELNFDDPRKVAEEQITLKGDRASLDLLYEVVNTYVQDFLLYSSPTRLSALLDLPLSSPSLPPENPPQEPPPAPQSATVSEEQTGDRANASAPFPLEKDAPTPLLFPSPCLKPKGLLAHQLFFGSLATAESGESLVLSTTQLFDLAAALDEYSTDIAVLPALDRPEKQQPAIHWTSAAAGAVLAVGLTTAALQLQRSSQNNTSTASSDTEELTASKEPAIAPLSLPSPPAQPASPGLPSPLSSLGKLPPPTPASPLPSRTPQASASPQQAQPSPPASVQIRPTGNKTSTPPRQQDRTRDAALRDRNSSLPQEPRVPVKSPSSPTSTPTTSPPPPAIARGAAPTADPNLTPRIPSLPPLESGSRTTASAAEPETFSDSPEIPQGQGGIALGSPPQVTEVRDYFQQNWQPPENLSEPLEYSLVLDRNGTIERIIPHGQTSGTYLDRTPMPLAGENFGISEVEPTQTPPQIRLILKPDGGVDTRLE